MNTNKTERVVALVAGEHSGDLLGAGLMQAIRKQSPQPVRFIGVGGPLMKEQGLDSFFPMEDLAIMGIAEVVRHLPKLLKHRRQLVSFIEQQKPDVMIGIDAPDFNLTVEKRLRDNGITTVHYVSPSVWAWREGRIKGIKKAVDHMLCLLPFEKAFYDRHQLPATFVGHPLADEIPKNWSRTEARQQLNLATDAVYLALLPGSRAGEIERMAEPFLQAAASLQQRYPQLKLLVPMISEQRAEQFRSLQQQYCPELTLQIIVGNSRLTMAAADYLILTSGTVALEAMLIKRPMVVAYKFSWLSYRLIKWLFHAPFFSLPNLLADTQIVPELAQDEASAENIERHLARLIDSDNSNLMVNFLRIHERLKVDANERAAKAVLNLIE
ncbi:lipid-A-disaccharide synthase [Idiomarina seosinensis]|uniref:lipid-A-disaccharide synthase n=1 Tax=Idiomarina seosinensis TaxID=281739 RepID=UPI0038511902